MMKILTTFALCALCIVSCQKNTDTGQKTLNIGATAKVKGMDPIYTSDGASMREVSKIYEGLLEYHYLKRPYELRPNLAEAMPSLSKDGVTYTFKIKKGIFFHDDKAFPGGKGRELTAEDFVYSIKRLADPKLQGRGWWLLDGKLQGLNQWRDKYSELPQTDYSEEVAGLKALDKYTLQFKLAKPFPQFLYALAMPFTYAVPRKVVEHYGKEFLNHPVGTGPFILPLFRQQSNKIVYTKNPNYRKKTFPCDSSPLYKHMTDAYCGRPVPFVEKVVVNIMVESQPRWLNFQKGKLDYIGVPKDNFASTIPDAKNLSPDYAKKGIELLVAPALDIAYVAFNHDLKLFQNLRLRQAMSLAYDVHTFNKLFNNSTSLPAQSVVPPGIAGYMKDFKNPYQGEGKAENIERAKKLLAEAGYPGGKGLPVITYDSRNTSTARQEGEYFKKQMAPLGIKIKVIQNTWPQMQKKIYARQVMTFGIGWMADYPDAENFLQLLYGQNRSPGPNGSGYNEPKFNALFEKAAVMADSPARTRLYEKLNMMAAEAMPWIFRVHRQTYVLKHKWLKNYMPMDFGAESALYLDIDMEEKKAALKRL